jgi:RNA polymerase sigma-70 factor (ECF subfamily)
MDWEGILRDHGPTVWRTLWRLLGHRADVEECFQEVFLNALQLHQRRPGTQFSAILQTMATARAVDRLRRRYVRRNEPNGEVAWVDQAITTEPSPSQLLEAKELSDRLRIALARLPEKQAEIFCLHALSGWSYQEIGQAMEMSSNAVGVTIHRTRQRLRELLGESYVNETKTGGVQ